jgi:hypothetical protein
MTRISEESRIHSTIQFPTDCPRESLKDPKFSLFIFLLMKERSEVSFLKGKKFINFLVGERDV